MTNRMTDWAYATGWMAVRAMPEFAVRNVFDAGARYAARRGGPDQLRKNLARVIGVAPDEVPDALMRASLASYARYWREAFRLPTMDLPVLARELHDSVLGQDNLDAALAGGRGAVMALPHSGNWDMAGVWLAHTYGTFTTVAERLKPESLYRRFIQYREDLGFEVLPLSGGERPPFQMLCDRLAENRAVCLMAERDLTRTGVEVEFFGEPTRMPAGPAKRPGRRCCRRTAGSRTMKTKAGASQYNRPWIAPAATSTPSRRRWPISSPRTSPPTPRTGTCCSRSGWPTCPTRDGRG
jgi:KDO2-lipid IV(A) lauroyltransferase